MFLLFLLFFFSVISKVLLVFSNPFLFFSLLVLYLSLARQIHMVPPEDSFSKQKKLEGKKKLVISPLYASDEFFV